MADGVTNVRVPGPVNDGDMNTSTTVDQNGSLVTQVYHDGQQNKPLYTSIRVPLRKWLID